MHVQKIPLQFKLITKDVVPKVQHIHSYSFLFVISKDNHYIYSKEEGGPFIYVALYFDDMLIGNNMNTIKEVKKQLSSNFNMKDLSATNFNLGMEIKRD